MFYVHVPSGLKSLGTDDSLKEFLKNQNALKKICGFIRHTEGPNSFLSIACG